MLCTNGCLLIVSVWSLPGSGLPLTIGCNTDNLVRSQPAYPYILVHICATLHYVRNSLATISFIHDRIYDMMSISVDVHLSVNYN